MPLVAAAAIVGGATLVASKNSSKAAKTAADASQKATDESIQLQREAVTRAEDQLSPYASAGVDALAAIRGMIGLPAGGGAQAGGAFAGNAGATAATSGPDWQRYLDDNPDVMAEAVEEKWDPLEYAQWHHQTYGRGEGRQVHQVGATQAMTTQPAPTSETPSPQTGAPPAAQPAAPTSGYQASVFANMMPEAQASFESSPWWEFAQTATDKAINDLDTRYGASGLLLSGGAVRARAEIAARLKGESFEKHYNQQAGAKSDYLSSLYALASGGQQAASGIASGGQTFANNVGNLLTNNAQVKGNAAVQGANGQNQALSDAVGFGGWALGSMNQPRAPSSLVSVPSVPNIQIGR